MNEKRLQEELSTYLDGEHADPEAMAHLLHSDVSANRRYREMTDVSNRMRSLSPPDVSPGFVTRVMIQVDEAPDRRRASRLVPALSFAAAALLLVAGAVVALHVRNGEEASNWAQVDEESILSEIEMRLAGGTVLSETELEYAEATPNAADNEIDAWSVVFGSDEWLDTLLSASEADLESDSMFGTLDETETEIFRELLRQSIEEEWTT